LKKLDQQQWYLPGFETFIQMKYAAMAIMIIPTSTEAVMITVPLFPLSVIKGG